jgi:hypothetical protein
MNGMASISACVDVSNDCQLECRIDGKRDVEFTFGTWEGGVELHVERYALERFVELAMAALNEPVPADPKAPRPVMISPGSEIRLGEVSTPSNQRQS